MINLPTEAQVRARAESDKLIDAGAALPRDVVRQVSKLLLAESQAPALPPAPTAQLVSRHTHEVPGGTFIWDLTFHPNPNPEKE